MYYDTYITIAFNVFIALVCIVPPVIFFRRTYLPNLTRIKMLLGCVIYGCIIMLIINFILFMAFGIETTSVTPGFSWGIITYFICLKTSSRVFPSAIKQAKENLKENLKKDEPVKEPEQISLDSIIDMPCTKEKPKKSKKVKILCIILFVSILVNIGLVVFMLYNNSQSDETKKTAEASQVSIPEGADKYSIVYISQLDKKYHLKSCYTTKEPTMRAVSLQYAVTSGYEPCLKCKPLENSDPVDKSSTQKISIDDILNKELTTSTGKKVKLKDTVGKEVTEPSSSINTQQEVGEQTENNSEYGLTVYGTLKKSLETKK